jgi:hypothetical protein
MDPTEIRKQQNKTYYTNNRDALLNKKRSDRVICECGSSIVKSFHKHHLNSTIHLGKLQKLLGEKKVE